VIDDTYNANPASVLSSVEFAEDVARRRGAELLLIVGEMRELGAFARAEHERVGKRLAASGARCVVAVSGEARRYVEAAQGSGVSAVFAEDAESALAIVKRAVRPRDVILIKASRGVHAERIVEGLTERRIDA
jgi:UDP-N-acetylmuramoyl-tripeptide--D-alanyl-D-alanine ligase